MNASQAPHLRRLGGAISIPNSVTRIGDGALNDCGSLTSITVESLNNFYCSVGGIFTV